MAKSSATEKFLDSLDPKKVYQFELLAKMPEYQPRDKSGNRPLLSGHPQYQTLANSGIAWDDETGKARAWRLITGQDSIWVDEQPLLKDADIKDINRMLADESNELTFRKGFLQVRGTERLKMHALLIMDEYQGKEQQRNPKNRVYKMLQPELEGKQLQSQNINEFKALNTLFNMSKEQMLPIAMSYGVNTDLSDTEHGMVRIHNEMYQKVKENPSGFLKNMNNPKHEINYLVNKALADNIISMSQQQNKLTWVDGNVPVLDINPEHPLGPITYIVDKVIQKDKSATSFFKALKARMGELETVVS